MQGYSSQLGVASRNDISICFSSCFNFPSVQLNFCNLYILCYLLLKRQSTCLFLLEIKRQENLIYIILYLAAIREMYLLFNNIWKHYFLCISRNYFVFQTRRDVVYHISRKNKGKETHTTHTNTRHTYKSTPWKHRSLVLTQNTRPQPGKYPTKQLAAAGQPGRKFLWPLPAPKVSTHPKPTARCFANNQMMRQNDLSLSIKTWAFIITWFIYYDEHAQSGTLEVLFSYDAALHRFVPFWRVLENRGFPAGGARKAFA